jgi:hypothetical protein
VLNIELSNEVKKISITGKDGDEKVVMRQELSEDDLEQATGGIDLGKIQAGLQFDLQCSPNS